MDSETLLGNYIQNRYRLLQLLGYGGANQTFLAADEGQTPAFPCIAKRYQATGDVEAKFKPAARCLAELGQHPQIPALLDCCFASDCCYLVQEYIAGDNLSQIAQTKGAFSEAQIWHLLAELLPVLKFISDRQTIHGDIKPANIIRRATDNRLVLVDLSAAYWQQPNAVAGSPEYAAPEQAQGQAVGASDLYSLGVTCLYLLTLTHPFELFDTASNAWAWRQYLPQPVSDRLASLLDKLVQPALSDRATSADEVLALLPFKAEPCTPPVAPAWTCLQVLTDNTAKPSSFNAVAFSPDGNYLASGSDDKKVRLWDVSTGRLIGAFSEHDRPVNSIAFSADGKRLASASDDRSLVLWKIHNSQLVPAATLKASDRPIKSIAFSPDSQILASGGWDKTIKLWNAGTRAEISALVGHELQVSAIAFSPDGKMLASASLDRTVRLWDLQSPAHPNAIRIFSSHAWPVLAVAFSPDGKMLATAGDDRTIYLWDAATGFALRSLPGHSWSVVALAFSPDGQILASGSWDRTIKLWAASAGQEICTLAGHSDSVCALSFGWKKDGSLAIASASKDATMRLWQPPPINRFA